MIDLRKNKTKEQPLPKWFNGVLYTEGAIVKNPFSGASIGLTAEELSIYDYIMGCVMLNKYDATFNKATTWFRRANPDAYMVLLD
jgi:hypothetical protein